MRVRRSRTPHFRKDVPQSVGWPSRNASAGTAEPITPCSLNGDFVASRPGRFVRWALVHGSWSASRHPGRRTKDEGRTKDEAPGTKDRLLHGNGKCSREPLQPVSPAPAPMCAMEAAANSGGTACRAVRGRAAHAADAIPQNAWRLHRVPAPCGATPPEGPRG